MVNEIVFGAVCAAADADNFASYIKAQGSANTSRISRILRIAEELNAYDEELKRLSASLPRTWASPTYLKPGQHNGASFLLAVNVDLLTLKRASGAPRSPVNNCRTVASAAGTNSLGGEAGSRAEALLNEQHAVVDRPDTAAVRAIVARIKEDSPKVSRKQRSYNPFKFREVAPSARLTEAERARIPEIRQHLIGKGIVAEKWQLEALTRGAMMKFGDESVQFSVIPDWADFYQ